MTTLGVHSVNDAVTLAGGVLAVTAGAGVLARKVWRIARALDRLLDLARESNDIVSRELEHNHGSSIKDDVHGLALAVGELQRRQDDQDDALQRLLILQQLHHPNG